ncbi:hypothetical protein [Herbaspirillum seropedicae]|uniref:hypothetical protein n=1 Tax=Herbaspirillum seropedicae TaxID=964 RepID=UPI002856D41B|nr:hypothetical protein [Herbaspirillum seropedicae]MDR6397295.1 hypothetical protein [Herbaspirillum seropedicae]
MPLAFHDLLTEQKGREAEMDELAKFRKQMSDLGLLLDESKSLFQLAEKSSLQLPAERQECREVMASLRHLIGQMKPMCLQLEILLVEYGKEGAAANDKSSA